MADTSSTTLELPLLETQGPRSTTPVTPPKNHPRPKGLRRVQKWFIEAWRDLLADLVDAKWAGGISWIPLYLFTLSVSFQALVLLAAYDHESSTSGTNKPGCRPDGSFGHLGDYNPWGISGFFEITIRMGSLSFTEAKVIDIAWDLIIGRGGQSVLVYYSWKAFSSYVRVSMESRPVTLDTFFTIHLEGAASITSTAKMIHDFFTRRRLRSRVAMTFIIVTMNFILAWPTLASSMTGYAPAEEAFVLDVQQNLVPMNKINTVAYVVHDGWRVNLTGDHLVAYDERGSRTSGFGILDDYNSPCIRAYSTDPCGLVKRVSDYVRTYGFLGLDDDGVVNNVETKWNETALPRPALNVSAFYIHEYSGYYGHYWTDSQGSRPYANASNRVFTAVNSNTTYTMEHVEDNGSCQTLERYQWGFSWLQLFIAMLLLLFWAIGVWVLWLKAHKELERRGGVEASNRYKAVLDLASALDQEVSKIGETTRALTNKQLEVLVKERLHGGAIESESPVQLSRYNFRTSLWPWIMEHKWWVLLFLLTSWMVPIAGFPATFGSSIAAALLIGKTTRTRILLFICGSIIFGMVTGSVVVPLIFATNFGGAGKP